MKVVPVKSSVKGKLFPLTYSDCIKLANELEENNEVAEAIKVYQRCIKLKPLDEYAYDRLMILYRKKKEYNKELDIINDGIKTFENLYNESSKIKNNSAIQRISKSILKLTGLSDKKGKAIFKPQPILKWYKRAILLKKKLKN